MNNSTSTPIISNPHARPKTAISTRLNINGFIEDFGIEHCALLTLVFPRHVGWNQANEAVCRAQRTLFTPLFSAWVCVVELHKDGRPHFHFLVAHAENLRTGYDFAARDAARDLNRQAQSQHRRLTPSEASDYDRLIKRSIADASALRRLWFRLKQSLPEYGIGRKYPGTLEPIRSAVGISLYLTKSFGSAALQHPIEMKRARTVRYSKGQNRRGTLQFGYNGPRSKLARRQTARVAKVLGVVEGEFSIRYGRHWHYHFMDMVECLQIGTLIT